MSSMLVIFHRRVYQIFRLVSFSRRDANVTIIPFYRRLLGLTSNYPAAISSLCFSSLSSQDTNIMTSKMANASTLDVDYQQLLEAQKDDKILIVDVREQDEINETGKLPMSIHIPMGDVKNTMLNISDEDFEKLYGKPKPTKNTKIIFSCRSGKRSKMVQEEMQKLGYVSGGWLDWESKQKNN
ncbi:heat shock protein 67B2-like isoform X2 [Pseudomyrmex gracilis]|uniref:heat shock protein 67B2-like isoform X2 n=1 Tax=Pseudomyrmex gracilis TaxID=219809 RepID=UPI0009954EFD|nr:heat shock protein 67B2-like isoform X2 [Pseudomyrmex gracilis]